MMLDVVLYVVVFDHCPEGAIVCSRMHMIKDLLAVEKFHDLLLSESARPREGKMLAWIILQH